MTKEKTLFPKIESTKEIQDKFDKLEAALRQAAEEAYQNEMVDTNMAMLDIREVAEKYEYYTDEDSRQDTIKNCIWATKEEWIEDIIFAWMR